MKMMRRRHRKIMTWGRAVIAASLLTSAVALGQGVQAQNSDGSDKTEEAKKRPDKRESIEELRERVEEIERTTRAELDALRRLILQQEAELARLRQPPTGSEPPPDALQTESSPAPQSLPQAAARNQSARTSTQPRPQTPATQATPPQLPPGEISGAAERDTFRRDTESVARVNNRPLASAPAGFFEIPGTPARVKLDGYFKLDTVIDPRPAGNTEQFNTSTIPISQPGVPQPTTVNVFARQTRFNLDFRSAVGDSEHDLRVFLEFDFYGGEGVTDPRLRHAYGQYKNFLVGHTWSTWVDPDAFPDTLDFQAPSGLSDERQAQARFTLPLNTSHSLALAVERPDTSAARTLVAGGKTYNAAPDSVIRWRYEQKRGHLQVASVLRALGYQTDERSRTVFGWGVNASTALKTFGLDSLQLYGSYGEGHARYIKNVGTYDLDLDNAGSNIRALPAVATYVGYTRHWARPLRSTVTFGFDRVQNTAAQPGTAFSKSYYMSGNLVWNPIGHLNLGAEFLHGWQVQKSGAQGNANRIQLSIKYDLYRKE